MQVGTAFLCDFAEVREGLLFALGGGIARLWREEFPAPMGVSLALIFELNRRERDRPHELEIVVQDDDGTEIARVNGGFQAGGEDLAVHEMATVPIALNLSLVGLAKAGQYSIEILVDGEHRRSLHFQAKPRPAPSPPNG